MKLHNFATRNGVAIAVVVASVKDEMSVVNMVREKQINNCVASNSMTESFSIKDFSGGSASLPRATLEVRCETVE